MKGKRRRFGSIFSPQNLSKYLSFQLPAIETANDDEDDEEDGSDAVDDLVLCPKLDRVLMQEKIWESQEERAEAEGDEEEGEEDSSAICFKPSPFSVETED